MFSLETDTNTISSIKPEHNKFMSYCQNYNYATKSSDKTQSNKLYRDLYSATPDVSKSLAENKNWIIISYIQSIFSN
jgi:hypothetical protein